jgi:hypothetical protein
MFGKIVLNKNTILVIGLAVVGLMLGGVLWYVNVGEKEDGSEPVLTGDAAALREMKKKWETVIETKGGEEAYIEFLAEVPKSPIDPHSQAHAFGEALYNIEGIEGLKACDSAFEFGCYHSFFGVAVHNEGIETLPQFDEACKTKYGDMNLPCQHGIGHGVLVYTDYNKLQDALALCETINKMPTGGCSSGVFMEYNFHTMDDSAAGFRRDESEGLYAPCDTLPERFQQSCYFEQVQWWQGIFQGDFKKIGELCSKFDIGSANYTACYNGTGNYAAAQADRQLEDIVELCGEMPEESSRALCHEGASWLLRSEEDKKDDAKQLCELLEGTYESECLDKLNY